MPLGHGERRSLGHSAPKLAHPRFPPLNGMNPRAADLTWNPLRDHARDYASLNVPDVEG